jgi:L-threonylcarbamoyladenylate synthase
MEILRLDEGNFDDAVARAAAILKRGGVVVYPTDTLYGIAVDALNPNAIERLRSLKGRERKKPISIVVPDLASIEVHAELPEAARTLAHAHLPGALTLVLPAKAHVPEALMLNDQVGIRIPNDAFARALSSSLGSPITATSANLAGQRTPRDVQTILEHFGSRVEYVDLVIDDGERAGENPSTVVTFINGAPYIIREGAISREELGL